MELLEDKQTKATFTKKRKKLYLIFGLCIIFAVTSLIVFHQYRINSLYAKVVAPIPEDRIPAFLDDKNAYALGLNTFGMPVFENSEEAFKQACIDYASGIAAIQQQFQLKPISPSNWKPYGIYGAQMVTKDDALREKCINISKFFDYYENSFPDS